jgi:hypothetical protein
MITRALTLLKRACRSRLDLCLWPLALLAAVLTTIGCAHSSHHPYALGIYGVPCSALATVAEAGFHIAAGPADANFLGLAQNVGLKVLASPGTVAGPSFSPARARQAVRSFDQHPAVWAWYLVDEPDLNGISPKDVRRAQAHFESAGARKPTALALFQGSEAWHYGDLADITLVDRYPIPWLPLANFPQHVRLARLALGRDKPLIAVIQAFDWSYYPALLPDEERLRAPTAQELRCMTYCALARGATGIFYYCFDDGKWSMSDHPAVWESLKEVVAEVNRRLPLFQAEHLWWPYVHEFPEPSTRFNAALESSIIPTLLRVKQGTTEVPAGDYLLAVNTTDLTLPYHISLPPTSEADVAVLGEARHAVTEGAWLEDNFGPFDVHIYGPLRQAKAGERREVSRAK